jgi:hypothetical protein
MVSFTVEAADEEAAEAMVDAIIDEEKVWTMPDISIDWHSCDDCCRNKFERHVSIRGRS